MSGKKSKKVEKVRQDPDGVRHLDLSGESTDTTESLAVVQEQLTAKGFGLKLAVKGGRLVRFAAVMLAGGALSWACAMLLTTNEITGPLQVVIVVAVFIGVVAFSTWILLFSGTKQRTK